MSSKSTSYTHWLSGIVIFVGCSAGLYLLTPGQEQEARAHITLSSSSRSLPLYVPKEDTSPVHQMDERIAPPPVTKAQLGDVFDVPDIIETEAPEAVERDETPLPSETSTVIIQGIQVETRRYTGHSIITLLFAHAVAADKPFRIENPSRLVVDISGLTVRSETRNLQASSHYSAIRIGRKEKGARLVFDLKNSSELLGHQLLENKVIMKIGDIL